MLWCVLILSVLAQAGAPAAQPAGAGFPVIYRGEEIVRSYHGVGDIGPADRARLTSQRLNALVSDAGFDPARVTVSDRETHSELVYEDRLLGIVTDDDAAAVGQPRSLLARQIRDRLAEVIVTTREEFSVTAIARGVGWALAATAVLGLLLRLLARATRRVEARVGRRYVQLADPRPDERALAATGVGGLVHDGVTVAGVAIAVVFVAAWAQV